MNLIEICTLFPDQGSCIEHLEEVRFGDTPYCPHCGGLQVARKADGDRIGRWNCHDCKSSFNVLADTIFQKTRIDLRKWFVAIGLILNAKKSLSSCQLARDIDLNQKSAWYMMQRIRAELNLTGYSTPESIDSYIEGMMSRSGGSFAKVAMRR